MLHALLICCAILGDGGKPAEPTAADRAAYEAARAKAGKNPAAHVQLALWCDAHGFTAERIKHLTLAAGLDPSKMCWHKASWAGRVPGQAGEARTGQGRNPDRPKIPGTLP